VQRKQEYALGGLGCAAQDQEELPLEADERQRQMGNVEMSPPKEILIAPVLMLLEIRR
jgi:hypothetical protein